MMLLVHFDPDWHWLRIGASSASSGEGIPIVGADELVIAVAPGDAVALHWVELPNLAPAQALAAARLLASDVSASSDGADHVAIGAAGSDGRRLLAIVDATRMAGWLARLAGAGIDPAHLVPEPLLLPLPETGVSVMPRGDQWLVRGPQLGLAGEPALIDAIAGAGPRQTVTPTDYENGLAARAVAAIDLRQGGFARSRQWLARPAELGRLALLAALVPALWIAGDMAQWWRHSLAADRAEARLVDNARSALPRGTVVTASTARAQLERRLAQKGAGAGFAAHAARLLQVIEANPELRLVSLNYGASAGLSAVVEAPTPAAVAALGKIPGARVGQARDVDGAKMVAVTVPR